ncbi:MULTISPECIES: radical SAM/SPASM domain-containing protein [Desulfosediminicola]|uniref:radical SAM/SPASM domain-containing protein n=1 Tax=Desulfosediminicola TaxID=2886823 RepID=UPI0010AC575D|nr:radical SAM protein [Desulfosediminicola ganghwensis]
MTCLGEQLGMEFTPEEIAECRENNGLLSVELELSRVCNLRCVYCYASSGEPLTNELSLAEIYDIIDQAKGLGAKKIIVLGGGEPMLYPHLREVIDYILAGDMVVELFTNGINLTEEFATWLYQRQVGVVLKMNSREEAVQDSLAGRKGAYTTIVKAMSALRYAGYPDEHSSLGVETIICKQNYDELPELWRWARRRGITPYVETLTNQGRATEGEQLEVEPEKVKAMFEELARIDREEFECGWTPHPPLVASHCARHEYSCTVTTTGEIQPCPGVSVSAGSTRQQSLAEIIRQSRVMQDMRNIRSHIKGACASCEMSDDCYGCRGHAYQVTGDYFAEDPLCWLKK